MYVRHVAFIWKVIMNPNGIEIKEMYHVFFDTTGNVARSMHFNPQTMADDHEGGVTTINLGFRDVNYYNEDDNFKESSFNDVQQC